MDSISAIGGNKKSGGPSQSGGQTGGAQDAKPFNPFSLPFAQEKPRDCSAGNQNPDQVSLCHEMNEDIESMNQEKDEVAKRIQEGLKANWPFGKQE